MASIFRRSYTATDPQTGRKVKRKTRKWYGKYTDANGAVHRVPLSANKTVAQQMLADLVRKAELGKVGIADPYEEHRRRPLAEHLEDWRVALLAKGTSAKQVGQVVSRVRRVLEWCRFVFMADLAGAPVQSFLAELRRDRPRPSLPEQEAFTRAELAGL